MTLGWANGSKFRLPQDVIDRTTDGHSFSLYQFPFTYKHCNILHERSIQLCPVHIASCAIDSTRKNSRCLFSREFTTQRKKKIWPISIPRGPSGFFVLAWWFCGTSNIMKKALIKERKSSQRYIIIGVSLIKFTRVYYINQWCNCDRISTHHRNCCDGVIIRSRCTTFWYRYICTWTIPINIST